MESAQGMFSSADDKNSSLDSPSHLSLIALSSGGRLAHLQQDGDLDSNNKRSVRAVCWCSRGIEHHGGRS